MSEEFFEYSLALGKALGKKPLPYELSKRIEAFRKEMKELGVEVKVSVSIEIPRGKVNVHT